jgi:(2R)-3-sulfolactate dehydrogenase (NADP+)
VGGTDPAAELEVVDESPGTISFDGNNGLGHWQVWEAAVRATEKASTNGLAAASVANSGHCGALGLYSVPMTDAGLVGLVFSTGPAVMPPWEGHSRVLSTSPIAAGIPIGEDRTAIVDMATAAVARGRIVQRAAAGEALEEGWAFDADGVPTTDPNIALAGMQAPVGGAKGYALAFLIEALTGGIVGPSLAGDIADSLNADSITIPQRTSHLVLALDPARLDGDGRSEMRLALLAERVEEAGGRVPGGNRLNPGKLSDDHPLDLVEASRGALRTSAEIVGMEPTEGATL